MSNKFFGQYLLEKGVISKEQLLTAIDVQQTSNLTLGTIAINKGYLTEGQAELINLEQQRTDQRFGSLAVSMGYLEGKQVSELFIYQQRKRKFFGEILVEQQIFDKTVLLEHLEAHADLKKQSALMLDGAIYAHQYGKLIADIIGTTVRLFLRIAKMNIQVSDIIFEPVVLQAKQLAFSQEAELPEKIKIGYIMGDKLTGAVANNFLNIDVSDNPEVSQDAVCEFLNMVLGNALAGHCKNGHTVLAPPAINEPGSDLKEPYQSVFNITMVTPEQNFMLFVYNH